MRARWLLPMVPVFAGWDCENQGRPPIDTSVDDAGCPEGLESATVATAVVTELVVDGASALVELDTSRRYDGVPAACVDDVGDSFLLILESGGDPLISVFQSTANSGTLELNGEAGDVLVVAILGDNPTVFENGDWLSGSWFVAREGGGTQVDFSGIASKEERNLTIQAQITVGP